MQLRTLILMAALVVAVSAQGKNDYKQSSSSSGGYKQSSSSSSDYKPSSSSSSNYGTSSSSTTPYSSSSSTTPYSSSSSTTPYSSSSSSKKYGTDDVYQPSSYSKSSSSYHGSSSSSEYDTYTADNYQSEYGTTYKCPPFWARWKAKLRIVKKKIKGAIKVVGAVIAAPFVCLAAELHAAWHKLKSAEARMKYWLTCKKQHLKHWLWYKRQVQIGKRKIRSSLQQQYFQSLCELEAKLKDDYHRLLKECGGEEVIYKEDYKSDYGEQDTVYDETIVTDNYDIKIKPGIDYTSGTYPAGYGEYSESSSSSSSTTPYSSSSSSTTPYSGSSSTTPSSSSNYGSSSTPTAPYTASSTSSTGYGGAKKY